MLYAIFFVIWYTNIYKTLIVELCCKLASVNLPLNYLSVNISRMLYCFPLLLSFISCSTNHIINGNKYVLHFLQLMLLGDEPQQDIFNKIFLFFSIAIFRIIISKIIRCKNTQDYDWLLFIYHIIQKHRYKAAIISISSLLLPTHMPWNINKSLKYSNLIYCVGWSNN